MGINSPTVLALVAGTILAMNTFGSDLDRSSTISTELQAARIERAGRSAVLNPDDVRVIKKVATTEVVARLKSGAFEKQLHGVIDTLINRLAAGRWGATMAQVANSPWQFSGINSDLKGAYGSVENMPDSVINPKVATEVERWLALRAGGTPSSVGDNLSYLNPLYSSQRSLRRWGWSVVRQAGKTGYIYGAGKAKHYHGTAADLERYRTGPIRVLYMSDQSPKPAASHPTKRRSRR